MAVAVLLANPGSTSRKYEYYQDGQSIVQFHFETLGDGSVQESVSFQNQTSTASHPAGYLDHALIKVQEFLSEHGYVVERVAVRVVAPGRICSQHHKVDNTYLIELEKQSDLAPLHAPVMLREIKAIQHSFSAADVYAISDSAFHATVPDFVSMISVSQPDRETLGIQRYGYHGLSCASIVRQLNADGVDSVDKTVVVHLGGGISIMAVDNNQSCATSMGLTPGSGVVMSSRGGDISAGTMLALMQKKNMTIAQAYDYLYRHSGLQGICAESDLRIVMDRMNDGDKEATLAVETLCYQIQSLVAAYVVLMGGLDRIVLTATALERNDQLRALLMNGLGILGVELDSERNRALDLSGGRISSDKSSVEVVVLPTQESAEMYQACVAL